MNPSLQGYLAATEEALADQGALADAATELRAVADLVDGSTELTLSLNDGALPAPSRRAVLDHLLEGKVRPEVVRLVHQAVTVVPAGELTVAFHWLANRVAVAAEPSAVVADEEVLGRLGSRNRVSGYAAAVFEDLRTADLEEVEDQLFRFARTVESSRRLRIALGDRDLPVATRQQVITELIGGKVLPATLRLAHYAVRGGRARDIVATLDALVEDAAAARGWRVARVRSAAVLDDAERSRLGDALVELTGKPVDLQVTVDPRLLAGVVVQVGDLLVDGSTLHRIEELREHFTASEEAYRIKGNSATRESIR